MLIEDLTHLRSKVYKGQLRIVYPDRRPAERLYLTVSRVAKDGTWADLQVRAWAVLWTKRVPVKNLLEFSVESAWSQNEINEQYKDWQVKQIEAGRISVS